MKTRLVVVAISVVALGTAISAILLSRTATRPLDMADREALIRTDRYCAKVRSALQQDADDLSSSNMDARIAAEDRFMEPMTLHSWHDLTLCGVDADFVDTASCGFRPYFDDSCLAERVRGAMSWVRQNSTAWDLPRVHEHCSGVKVAMRMAARGFESGDRDQIRFQAPFGTMFSWRSPLEIALCSPAPPDLHELDSCRRAGDYACLARLARAAEKNIYVPLDRD